MIHAYSEIYLDDAMNTLAEVFSYVPDARQADVLFQRFVMSGIAYQFGKGNPRYLNMPSQGEGRLDRSHQGPQTISSLRVCSGSPPRWTRRVDRL